MHLTSVIYMTPKKLSNYLYQPQKFCRMTYEEKKMQLDVDIEHTFRVTYMKRINQLT